MSTEQNIPSDNFIIANIKIAHPEWNYEQINKELIRKREELKNQNNNLECEFCSS